MYIGTYLYNLELYPAENVCNDRLMGFIFAMQFWGDSREWQFGDWLSFFRWKKIYPFGVNLFHLPSLELYWWAFIDRDMDWRMCPSTSRQRHAQLRQETRLHQKRDGISCDHSEASTNILSHGQITHIALPWQSPGMILSVKDHSVGEKTYIPLQEER